MNTALNILIFFAVFTIVTTLLSIYTRNKHVVLHRLRLQFTVGGILLFIGKEKVPHFSKPVGKKLHMLFVIVTFLGIILFYFVFVPEIVKFVKSFLEYTTGTSSTAPPPVMVPVPLLFQFQDIVPYILIAIGIAVIVHEFMHAFIAIREGVTIRSWGIGLMFLIPLAFVELDENSFNNSSRKSKINIVSAGIFGNAITTLIIFLILLTINTLTPMIIGIPSTAVAITSIDCSICNTSLCPARVANLKPNTIIVAINNISIDSINKFVSVVQELSVGSNISIDICDYNGFCETLNIYLNAHKKDSETKPCIGAVFNSVTVFVRNDKLYRLPWFENLVFLLTTILVINFSLFVVNAIPLFITDGALFLKYSIDQSSKFSKIVSMKIIDILNALIIIVATSLSSYILLSG
ncbi:MAG: M50 family metallopeptidase [Ignisphaera sp.]